jgi:uncharacterized damage-inducible protein DinB
VAEILEMFDAAGAKLAELVGPQDDRWMMTPWRFMRLGELIFEMPRMAVLQTMLVHHMIHHRGQLSVYLRMRDVPLPSVYAPTAAEDIMGG